jgi:hypothetical protein
MSILGRDVDDHVIDPLRLVEQVRVAVPQHLGRRGHVRLAREATRLRPSFVSTDERPVAAVPSKSHILAVGPRVPHVVRRSGGRGLVQHRMRRGLPSSSTANARSRPRGALEQSALVVARPGVRRPRRAWPIVARQHHRQDSRPGCAASRESSGWSLRR